MLVRYAELSSCKFMYHTAFPVGNVCSANRLACYRDMYTSMYITVCILSMQNTNCDTITRES